MIVLSVGIDTLKALGKCKAVDYTWAHGRSCIVLSFFFAINTVIGKHYCFCKIIACEMAFWNAHICKFSAAKMVSQIRLDLFQLLLNSKLRLKIISALFALNGMNIPMYNAMRRCVPIANLLLGVLFLRIRPTRGITLSVLTITAGTLVAAFGDLNFDSTAYTFGAISVISNAAYLTTLQKTGMEKNLGAISIAYINRLLSTQEKKMNRSF